MKNMRKGSFKRGSLERETVDVQSYETKHKGISVARMI